jgi:hypothetical protein
MTHAEIAGKLKDEEKNIILLYAFNATGKTRLCVEYKNITKTAENKHTGVYYNAYSEDLFQWDNDVQNRNGDITLRIVPSSLNEFHSFIVDGEAIRKKLEPYQPTYQFKLDDEKPAEGIRSVTFFKNDDDPTPIKISRGEERIFVWCFFLALFEVETWSANQSAHIYIDDPVSSLDEHNIFITAQGILELIKVNNKKDKRIIISTHHFGLFSILNSWLTPGKEKTQFGPYAVAYVLSDRKGDLTLVNTRKEVFLYHLHLLQLLEAAKEEGAIFKHQVVLLRQVLENVSSFLGSGSWSFVLSEIGIPDPNGVAATINGLSHQNVYSQKPDKLAPNEESTFIEVLDGLRRKYNFKLHD